MKGKYGKKDLIVLPSLSALAYGTDVLKEEPLSPFLQQDLGRFSIWAIEDKPYFFSRLESLK